MLGITNLFITVFVVSMRFLAPYIAYILYVHMRIQPALIQKIFEIVFHLFVLP